MTFKFTQYLTLVVLLVATAIVATATAAEAGVIASVPTTTIVAGSTTTVNAACTGNADCPANSVCNSQRCVSIQVIAGQTQSSANSLTHNWLPSFAISAVATIVYLHVSRA